MWTQSLISCSFLLILLLHVEWSESHRFKRNADGGDGDPDRQNHYLWHKNRYAKHFSVRDVEGGGEAPSSDISSSQGADGSESEIGKMAFTAPPFDNYNLNELEIAVAQTIYLMIRPELQNAVDFKMNEAVNRFKDQLLRNRPQQQQQGPGMPPPPQRGGPNPFPAPQRPGQMQGKPPPRLGPQGPAWNYGPQRNPYQQQQPQQLRQQQGPQRPGMYPQRPPPQQQFPPRQQASQQQQQRPQFRGGGAPPRGVPPAGNRPQPPLVG